MAARARGNVGTHRLFLGLGIPEVEWLESMEARQNTYGNTITGKSAWLERKEGPGTRGPRGERPGSGGEEDGCTRPAWREAGSGAGSRNAAPGPHFSLYPLQQSS